MIGNVIQEGKFVAVYDENNVKLFSIAGQLINNTQDSVTVIKDNKEYTYDAQGKKVENDSTLIVKEDSKKDNSSVLTVSTDNDSKAEKQDNSSLVKKKQLREIIVPIGK